MILSATQAESRELLVSVDTNIGGDSNVFLRSGMVRADGLWEFSPRALVRDTRDTLEYEFSYRPTYQAYFTTSGISGFDHNARGDLTWRPNPVASLLIGGSVNNSRIVRQFTDEIPPFAPTDPDQFILVESDGKRTTRSRANAGYGRSISQAQSVRADFSFDDTNFQDSGNVDSRSYALAIGTIYILNERTQMGLTATGRRREGRGNSRQFSNKTRTGEVSVSFIYAFTPTITLTARAGPSFTKTKQIAPFGVDADPTSPGVIDGSVKNSDISYVADASVTKRFQHSTISGEYSRFQSGSGGSAATSVVDSLTLSVSHLPSREWNFNFNAGWSSRKQISAINDLQGSTLERYAVSTSVGYRFSRQISIIARTSYQRFKNTTRSLVSPQITDDIVGSLTFRYSFDPMPF